MYWAAISDVLFLNNVKTNEFKPSNRVGFLEEVVVESWVVVKSLVVEGKLAVSVKTELI